MKLCSPATRKCGVRKKCCQQQTFCCVRRRPLVREQSSILGETGLTGYSHVLAYISQLPICREWEFLWVAQRARSYITRCTMHSNRKVHERQVYHAAWCKDEYLGAQNLSKSQLTCLVYISFFQNVICSCLFSYVSPYDSDLSFDAAHTLYQQAPVYYRLWNTWGQQRQGCT